MGELEEKKSVATKLFREHDAEGKGELSAVQMQSLHEGIRLGGISLAQVRASMKYCCLMDDCCEPSELFHLLQEMDRRYFLLQDLRWEFALLDGEQKDLISQDQVRFLFEVVHGDLFSPRRWERFLESRPAPGTGIGFAEVEVDLCDVPSREAIALEQLEEQTEQEEMQRMYDERKLAEELRRKEFEEEKRGRADEEMKRRREEEERRAAEEERLDKEREDEQRIQDEEERGKQESLERAERARRDEGAAGREAERTRELEVIEVQQALEVQRALERKAASLKDTEGHRGDQIAEEEAAASDAVDLLKVELMREAQRAEAEQEEIEKRARALAEEERLEAENLAEVKVEAERAAELEKEAEEEAKKAQEATKQAKNAEQRRVAEETEKAAKEKAKREKHKRIRKELKVAIKKKDQDLIARSAEEFKAAKLADTDGDLKRAEAILKRFAARNDLAKAIEGRTQEGLERAIGAVKRDGLEAYMPQEMAAANKMLLGLKRLRRLKDEILDLKQSTVAEIRSYGKPPPQVQRVMAATFLLLGNEERELKDWRKMQALIGKTGREGLKRRVMEVDPNGIPPATAAKVKNLLSAFDLEQVRDVSAGTAVFFAWSSATQEDVLERERQRADGIAPADLKGGHKDIKTEVSSGSLTVTI